MKDETRNLLAFLTTLAIVITLVLVFSYNKPYHKQEIPEADKTNISSTSRQDTTSLYDSAFVYNVSNYRVDVMYSSRKNEIRLLFRNKKEPESFDVYITPITPDFETYKEDIFARFIDIYETNKCRTYEYTTEYRNGQKVQVKQRNLDIPIMDEYYVRLVKHQNPSTGNMKPYITLKEILGNKNKRTINK